MIPHMFNLRLRSGALVRGLRVVAESREQAAMRVFRMYPGSAEHVEPRFTPGREDEARVPSFLRTMGPAD